jgi:tripartite-type tricarboxylate transporter receptor subunit TctC
MLSKYAFTFAAALICFAALAQDWKPARNVDIIVSSGAGAADRQARATQRFLQAMPAFPA